VPALAELEHSGARIGSIDIDVEDIFDPARPGEDATVYRWANDLHLRTRDDAIRSQLLFHETEPFSQQKIAETERLLRGRRYLYDAWIEPTCYHPADQTVDLRVRVRDVWSLNPGFSFNRKGGTNKVGFEVEDQDFLGRGELVSLSWGRNVDRDTVLAVYEDPQLFGSWWRGRVAYADSSDGGTQEIAVGRPFYSLDARWSAGTSLFAGDQVTSRYQEGEVLDAFATSADRFELYAGRSQGLQDGWARRRLAGFRYEDSRFTAAPDETLVAPLPEDRKLVYPWVGMEWIEDDFVTAHNQDQLARTEDLQFGRSLRAELGLAAPAWGADRTAAIAKVHANAGKRLGETQSVFFTADLSGRVEETGASDTLLQGEARYYHRQTPHALLFASARGALAERPDLDHQLLLGGDNGLRGYPLRYQSGTANALLTVEERIYTDWYPFHLFNVGAAAFADAGRAWGQDVAGREPLGLLSDVGVGLRIGNARTGLGNVLHIDLAVPLARQPGIDAVQFLVETRHSF
jgi:outer membrane translocation and assembly module TamA